MIGREIEIKYVLTDWKLETLGRRVQSLPFLNIIRSVKDCFTVDYYFPAHNTVSNIRLRDSYGMDQNGFSKHLQEITFKSKDQGTNFNRIEYNIGISDAYSAYGGLSLLLGNPTTVLKKQEIVYWTADDMVISIAEVNGNGLMYLEVEGPTEEQVLTYCRQLNEIFEMTIETRNFLEIYGTKV